MQSKSNNKIHRIAVGEVRSLLSEGYRYIGRVRKGDCESIFMHHLRNHARVQITLSPDHLQIIRDGVVIKDL